MLENSTSRTFSTNAIITITVVFSTTLLLVLCVNVLVIYAILSSPQIRQKRINLFLVGLAVADIFTSLTLIPFQLVQVWSSPNWPLGDLGVNVYNSFWNFCMVVPFLTVLAITVDRYLAITRSTFFVQVVTTPAKSVIRCLVVIWMYTTVCVLLLSITLTEPPHNEYAWNVPNKYYYPYLFIHVLVPLIIIFYCYKMILVTVRKSILRMSAHYISNHNIANISVKVNPVNPPAGPAPRQLGKGEIKLLRSIGCVVVSLVAIWIPVVCLEVVYALDGAKTWKKERSKLEQVGMISLWLICSNGILNPIIYAIRFKEIRKVLKKVLHDMYSKLQITTMEQ